jgi:hypothetical protein
MFNGVYTTNKVSDAEKPEIVVTSFIWFNS